MRETENGGRDGAQSDARRGEERFADPRLARLVDVWRLLPDAVRDELLELADVACRPSSREVR